jgi:NADH-quinone oxidoreductase subunit J
MSADYIIFFFSALVAVFGAVMMIVQKNPVASVLFLILSLVAQAVCYVQLGALFLGAILVIVYAGAIMVLFLFVIMLLNLRGRDDLGLSTHPLSHPVKFILAGLFGIELVMIVKSVLLPATAPGLFSPQTSDFGSVVQVARLLYTKYMYPFQLTGILLLVAVVGAVVMAQQERTSGDGSEVSEDSDEPRPVQKVEN